MTTGKIGRNLGSTNESRQARLQLIREQMLANNEKSRPMKDKEMRRFLRLNGHDIGSKQFSVDKQEIASENTYVADLAKYTYSQIVEAEIKLIDKTKEVLIEIMNSEDLPEITTTTGVDKKGVEFKTETIKTSRAHKIRAAQILADVAESKIKLISGEVVDTSIANYIENTKQLEKKLAEQKDKTISIKEKEYKDTQSIK